MNLEIVIDNIIPIGNLTRTKKPVYFKAGEDIIGSADAAPCSPNFIHVAVRETPAG